MRTPCQLAVGDEVCWIPDNDQGTVARVIPGQAIAIAWKGLGRTEWYSIPSGALEFIEPVDGAGRTPNEAPAAGPGVELAGDLPRRGVRAGVIPGLGSSPAPGRAGEAFRAAGQGGEPAAGAVLPVRPA
jgi:hypothetical protein